MSVDPVAFHSFRGVFMGRDREFLGALNRGAKSVVDAHKHDDQTPQSNADRSLRGIPGKATLPQNIGNGPTGDDYIDNGPACEADGARQDGCFLTAGQRARLIQNFQLRVLEASENYKHATAELRVDELITREEDASWLTMLIIDLLVGYMGGRLAHSLASLRADEATLEAIIATAGANASKMKNFQATGVAAFKRLSTEQLTEGVGKAMGAAKEHAAVQLKAGKAAPAEDKRSQKLSYLAQLATQTTLGYANMRERLPARATDAELVTLYHSFDPSEHQIPQYKEAITAKIERFRKSGIQMMGHLPVLGFPDNFVDAPEEERHRATGALNPDVEPDGSGGFRHSQGVFVIWHIYKSGAPRKLVFQYNGARANPATGHGRIAGSNLPDGQSGRDYSDYKSLHYVPDEFIDMAIDKHRAVWKAEPLYQTVDDTAWRQKMPPSHDPLIGAQKPAAVAEPPRPREPPKPSEPPKPKSLDLSGGNHPMSPKTFGNDT